MQITIDFSLVTFPTPEPYDRKQPEKQRENFAYVLNQLLLQAKQAGVKLTYTDDDDPIGLRLDGVERATKDGQRASQVFDFGAFQLRITNNTAEILHE